MTRNEDLNERMIRDLKEQIEKLKQQLQTGVGVGGGGGESAVDAEMIKKLRDMEEAQRNAWEEQERLSQALEKERQSNLAAAMSSMMQGVKEKKVIISTVN